MIALSTVTAVATLLDNGALLLLLRGGDGVGQPLLLSLLLIGGILPSPLLIGGLLLSSFCLISFSLCNSFFFGLLLSLLLLIGGILRSRLLVGGLLLSD